VNAVLHDRANLNNDEDGENEGAAGISNDCIGEEVDDGSSDANTNTVDHIGKSMQISSINVEVARFVRVRVSMVVVMIMSALTTKMEVIISTMQNGHLHEVEEETGSSREEHDISVNFTGVNDTVNRLLNEPAGNRDKEDDTNDGANNFSALPAVSIAIISFDEGKLKGNDSDDEADHVSGKMRSVAHDSNRASKNTTGQLSSNEEDGNPGDEAEYLHTTFITLLELRLSGLFTMAIANGTFGLMRVSSMELQFIIVDLIVISILEAIIIT